jgi:tripartite-type tricarboxylate transporter receptor subunit TctC
MIHRRSLITGLAALPLGAPLGAAAQAYPSGTVKVIVPYAPGAATDALARLLSQSLEEALGNKFIVENKGGGGTQVGTQAIAAAAADGLSLGFIDTAFVINPGLIGKALPYDTRKDFTPLSLTATAPFVLLVHNTVPAKTPRELIALAKSRSGGLSYGSAGVGSAPHLAGEQLRIASGAELTHVPYRGGSTVLNDLIAGHVHFGFTTVPTMIEHIRAGTVRALAVTGASRAVQLPDVPSMAESGLPSVDAAPLFGLIGPAGLAAPLVEHLGKAASSAVRTGALNRKLAELGFIPIGSSPAEFSARIEAEIIKWAEVVKAGNIKPNG